MTKLSYFFFSFSNRYELLWPVGRSYTQHSLWWIWIGTFRVRHVYLLFYENYRWILAENGVTFYLMSGNWRYCDVKRWMVFWFGSPHRPHTNANFNMLNHMQWNWIGCWIWSACVCCVGGCQITINTMECAQSSHEILSATLCASLKWDWIVYRPLASFIVIIISIRHL